MAADLHCHTLASDGSDPADEVVFMAKKRGLHVRTVLTHEDIAPGANAGDNGTITIKGNAAATATKNVLWELKELVA